MKRSMTFGFNYSLLLVVISTDIGQDCSPIARYLFIFEIIDLILPNRQVTKLLSGGSRISQGTPTPERGAPTYYFANFLPKNYMKMNESGPRGGRASLAPPRIRHCFWNRNTQHRGKITSTKTLFSFMLREKHLIPGKTLPICFFCPASGMRHPITVLVLYSFFLGKLNILREFVKYRGVNTRHRFRFNYFEISIVVNTKAPALSFVLWITRLQFQVATQLSL